MEVLDEGFEGEALPPVDCIVRLDKAAWQAAERIAGVRFDVLHRYYFGRVLQTLRDNLNFKPLPLEGAKKRLAKTGKHLEAALAYLSAEDVDSRIGHMGLRKALARNYTGDVAALQRLLIACNAASGALKRANKDRRPRTQINAIFGIGWILESAGGRATEGHAFTQLVTHMFNAPAMPPPDDLAVDVLVTIGKREAWKVGDECQDVNPGQLVRFPDIRDAAHFVERQRASFVAQEIPCGQAQRARGKGYVCLRANAEQVQGWIGNYVFGGRRQKRRFARPPCL